MTRATHDRHAGATRPAAVDAMLDDPATRGRVADLLLDAEPAPDETVDEVAGKLKRDSNDGLNDRSSDDSNEDSSEDSNDGVNDARRSPRPAGSTADGSARLRLTAGAGPGRMRAGAADGPATLRATWTARAPLLASALSLAGFLGAGFPESGPGGSVGSRRGSVGFPIASREVPFERSDAMRSLPRGVRFGSLSGTLRSGLAATVATLAAAPAVGADAVQWRVEDGGNGHWYAHAPTTTGFAAEALATSFGGKLASISSSAENEFVRALLVASGREFVMLGLIQADNQPTTNAGWGWVSGEPLGYTNWTDFDGAYGFSAPDDNPCACCEVAEDNQCNQGLMYLDGRWDDVERGPSCAGFASSAIAVIEWSADCDGNGVVDYGEIRAGLVADANANNVPDACECGIFPGFPDCCPGDVVLSGEVNGVDLAAVLGAWGTDGGKFPRADIDGSGVVDGADLTIVLNDWGLCE